MGEEILDPVLGIGVLWVAWSALNSRDLFRGVVLFIVFGLLMALTWARLHAPDIALAEAAIGAGLSGALLLSAVSRLGPEAPGGDRAGDGGGASRWLAAAASLAFLAVGAIAVRSLTHGAGEIPALIERNLDASGVSHGVTAVLLNFRAYDTWLEVVVLLVAAVALQALRNEHEPCLEARSPTGAPILPGVVRVLLPVMVLTAGYLFWRGTQGPGGAFQAGVVLGSAGVLTLLSGRGPAAGRGPVLVRGAVAAGALAFFLVALQARLTGGAFLQLPSAAAGRIILFVEAAVTISIALALTTLFAGSTAAARSTGPKGPGA